MKQTASKIALLAGLALASTHCGDDDASSSTGAEGGTGNSQGTAGATGEAQEDVVEMFSWWIAPGEAEALQALLDLYRDEHPESTILNAAEESGSDARDELTRRIGADDPPDLFQENANNLPVFLEDHPDGLESLDTLFEDLELNDTLFPEVIDNVTVDGQIVAMPVNLHRENSLFYNQDLFDANGLEPPTTLEELLAACDTLKAAGVTPIATSYQGWIQRIMFNSIAMGSMGAGEYYDYFQSGGAENADALRDAIDVFAQILESYINDNAGEADFGWQEAAQAVYDGDAAMFLHGDWAKGYFVQLGWEPGPDFGVVAAPGAADLFLYGVDTFAIPTGAKNPAGARDFLAIVASPEGQVAFNTLKGSSPIREDVPLDELDPLGRATLQDLSDATFRMLVATPLAWDDALSAFATDRDADALFQAFTDNPPE